ncbi:hypothetical protein [Deinococcus sp. UR1]|uniref:hypothetical protein n=1 Tax=Deinococcus sp. UR1 TaxID=1704277 RepID=UPI000ACD7242|nr:hypothetical protein [Deinococcus sp. UR1]
MIYTRKDLVRSYLSALSYMNAAEPLKSDAEGFTCALQQAFGIDLPGFLDFSARPINPLAFLFQRAVGTFRAQQDGALEEGWLVMKLENQGPSGVHLLDQYLNLRGCVAETSHQALALMQDILSTAWPEAPETVTSATLLALGFDDRNRPDPMEYW